jgi:tetratricopeptide (TPR) repeat protein
MRRLLSLACFLLVLSFSHVHAQDDQYIKIYSLIQEADASHGSKQYAVAMAKYKEALELLQQFQRRYPDWNSNIVKYRLSFLGAVISEIAAKHPDSLAPNAGGAVTNRPALDSAAAETQAREAEAKLTVLQNQIRQLQSDNSLLEEKLKEALRAQPATADPRAVARAEQEIRSLQKENSLLKVNLADRPVPAATAVDPKAVEQLKKELSDANRKSREAAERVAALASEKATLQKKLDSMIPAAWNLTNIEATQKALEAANLQLSEQTNAISRLGLEKTALQGRVRELVAEAQTMAAVRGENELLKRQLAELKSVSPADAQPMDRELVEAKAQIAVLLSDQKVLRLEKAALENKFKDASSPTIAPTENLVPPSGAADLSWLKQVERERDDLRERFDAAQKELTSLKSRGGAAKIEELQGEIQLLRTRLAVMETQKIPYTEEEAALIKKTEAQVVGSGTGTKSSRELPPGTFTLVAEAQKDFAARRFERAEEKYLQVLKQDENNVYTLANLAAIQIEMGRFDQAEKNIRLALTTAPEDSYALSLLGFLKFRQNQFDDALDALGRAAKLDPQNAEIQNYLGLTLSQKGMRTAAETALRKAITLDPNYGSAHYNLAVIYLTQKPPQVELARMHYRKAVSGGMSPSVDIERMLNPASPAP